MARYRSRTARDAAGTPSPPRIAACSRNRSAISAGVRPADGGNAGDGQQVLDERAGALLVDAFQRRQHAGNGPTEPVRGVVEDGRQALALARGHG